MAVVHLKEEEYNIRIKVQWRDIQDQKQKKLGL